MVGTLNFKLKKTKLQKFIFLLDLQQTDFCLDSML